MRSIVVFSALLLACGSPQHPTASSSSADAGPVARRDPPPLPSDRALGPDATFADLVTAAVHQDDRRASDSEAGCLLRVTPEGFVLDADLSVAVRGLPGAPEHLAARLTQGRGRARVLTRLGSYGSASPNVAVALTTLAGVASRRGVVLVLTPEGVASLRTDVDTETTPRSIDDAVAALDPDVAAVFVTADAAVPLTEVARLLAAIPASFDGRVALAAFLPDDARAPDEAEASTEPSAQLCVDGLPALADDAPVGDLATSSLRASLSSLVPAAQACVATSASGLGGLVRVAFRVDPTGHVHQACVREDETGDPTLRTCLVGALGALVFEAPTGGSVDVELPLRLAIEHDAPHHQHPLCR